MDDLIKIETFGGFAVICGESNVTAHLKSSSKICKLLQYLISRRHTTVSQEELIDVFYGSEREINPSNAVRTLVSRARSALANSGVRNAEDLILSKSGRYAWNNNLRCVVDAEEFEALCRKANSSKKREKRRRRLDLLLEAASLYKGDFLPDSAGEMWVILLAGRYRSLYVTCVHEALRLLAEAGRDPEAEELCAKALRLEPFDETILEYHLRALLKTGKQAKALEEYNKMETMYYDVLGVNFSDSLRELYSSLQFSEPDAELPMEDVLKEWFAGNDSPGAYYCDLSVFKAMCYIETRTAARSGRTAYIVRFVTKHDPGAKGGDVMKRLGQAIPGNLRTGDLFTRSGANQYMLLLHHLTYENCKIVVSRILSSLNSKYLPKIVSASIKPITDNSLIENVEM